jgi:hypothetical protein
VIDKDTGCFNGTKLCMLGDKDFSDWKRLSRAIRLMSYLQEQYDDKDVIYEVKTSNNNITKQISGQYVQKDLILDIASWISPEFYFRCNNIVTDYFVKEFNAMSETEKSFKIRELEMKMKDMEIETIITEKNDKINDLMKMLKEAEKERKADRLLLRSMGINLLDVKNQNIELLEEVQDTNTKLTTVQKKLNIAVEDRAPLPSQNKKKERFVLLKRNDEEDFPYYAVRGQHYYVQTVLKNQRQLFGEIEILLDFHCHPNSKSLFVRIRDNLKRKGVEFSNCKISIRDSSVSEGELVETMKQINDEKLNV